MIDQEHLVYASATTAAPDWWPTRSPEMPLFASREWLQAFADVRSDERHHWFRVRDPVDGADSMIRGTRGELSRLRRSLNPHHWMFEQTAYRQGLAVEDVEGWIPVERVVPSLVFVLPGLEFHVVGRRTPEAVTRLFRAAVATAIETASASVAIGFVQPDDDVTAEVARRFGFTEFTMATLATHHLNGRRAEEVFAAYSAKQRASFRRTRRRLERQHVECRLLAEPLAELDVLTELRCCHLTEHGRAPVRTEERRHLAALLGEFSDLVTVLVAVRGGEIRAFSLFLRDGDTWHSYMTGRCDAAEDRDMYFELTYYLPIEIATARGYRDISYGYGTEEAKRLRGCELEPVQGYVLLLDGEPRGEVE